MFTAFQRLSFGWMSKDESRCAVVEAPLIKIPENTQDVPQNSSTAAYECLSDIFEEMVSEQHNSLSKW